MAKSPHDIHIHYQGSSTPEPLVITPVTMFKFDQPRPLTPAARLIRMCFMDAERGRQQAWWCQAKGSRAMTKTCTATTAKNGGAPRRDDTIWLTPDEVAVLTECNRRSTQCIRLAKMGIPFRENFTGRPLVERTAVLHQRERPERTRDQPNWAAMGPA